MKWIGKGGDDHPHGGPGRLVEIVIDLPDRFRARPSAVAGHLVPYLGRHDRTLRGPRRASVRVDVNVVWPSERRPWIAAYTVGMSARPMTVPSELADRHSPFAELYLRLPPNWVPEQVCPLCDPPRVERNPVVNRRTAWPFEWLGHLAYFPHERGTFLAPGHLSSYDDLAPLHEGLPFAGCLFDPGWDEAGDRPIPPLLRGDGTRVEFLGVTLLHVAELRAFRAGRGRDVVLALDAAKVTDLLNLARPSCVAP